VERITGVFPTGPLVVIEHPLGATRTRQQRIVSEPALRVR